MVRNQPLTKGNNGWTAVSNCAPAWQSWKGGVSNKVASVLPDISTLTCIMGFVLRGQCWTVTPGNHVRGAAKVCVRPCRVARGVFQEAFGLHYTMFLPTLYSQCTPEQSKKWLPLAKNFKAIGTYAQTELGHGQSLSCRESWDM